jgi:very-short-patch-repair endonuclease
MVINEGLVRRAAGVAEPQASVATRKQLIAAGVPRWFIRNELGQRRWAAHGRQVVVLHNGPLPREATWWVAVLAVAPAAVLDGVTALQASNVHALTDMAVHVSVPKGARPRRPAGVRVHETRRYRADEVVRSGVPRMRPPVAAVHAALWARTERQATYFLVLVVQQGLATADQLGALLRQVRRHRFRRALTGVVKELALGSRSLGELDVSRALRARGLPEPTRQSVRRRPGGTEYLDCEFIEYALVLEVDGAGHEEAAKKLDDLLRDLRLTAEGRSVLRISLVAWVLDREAVLDALQQVFASRGWRGPAA